MAPESDTDVAGASDAADRPEAASAGKRAAPAPLGGKGCGWVVNKSQLASVLGKPMTTVERLLRSGAPVLKHGAGQRDAWEFDTAAFIEFYLRDALEKAGLGQGELSYEVARRRDKDAQAKLRELDLLQRTGKMIDIEDVRPKVREAFTTTRSRMLAVPSQIIGLTTAQQRQLEDAINDALAELSDPQTWHKGDDAAAGPATDAQH